MKEKVCKEHYQKNLEEEEEGIDQLTLSQYFTNRAKNPSASPSMGTPLTSGASATTRKRSRILTKSADYSSPSMKKARALKARLDAKHPSDEEDSPRKVMKDGSSSKSFVDLKNFSIVVNGVCMDSQFSTSARVKYYELCFARKSYLHDGFPKNINCMLAIGIILGIVSISDDIKASTLHTSLADFKGWGKTLAGFQHFGMDVGFLQERLREISMLATEFQECSEANRHSEVLNEENELHREIESIEKRLMELKEAAGNLRGEREALDAYFQTSNLTFQEMAKRPW